jgi:hypothetical protein
VPVSSSRPIVTAGDVLTLDELRYLRRTSTLRGAGLVPIWDVTGAGITHHRYAQQPEDHDLESAGSYPISRRAFGGAALRDLSGRMFVAGVLTWPGWREPRMLRNTRTTAAGPLARALLAPYWVNYHLEHHLLIFVPCWKLPQAHALLLAKGYGARMEIASGYGAVLSRATGAEAPASI